MANTISVKEISAKILLIRGKRVMLDRDLAKLYMVSTKALNQAVKRNIKRFPDDFMFQLTQNEKKQVVTICDHLKAIKFSPQLPYAFTEQGVAMLSSVLNSDRAIQVNIQIMRAFVQLCRMFLSNDELRQKIEAMEKEYDKRFAVVFEVIRKLLEPPKQTRAIGFHAE